MKEAPAAPVVIKRAHLVTFLGALLACIAVVLWMVGPYLLALFLGGTLAMLAYPVFQWLRARKWGPRLAAAAVTALLLLGVPGAFLAGGLTFIFAWIPVLGAAPAVLAGLLYLYAQGSPIKMSLMAALGLAQSAVDNLIRPMVLRGRAGMHPLVGLVAIISGIQMFGILGVFIGPILAAMLLSLLKIWPAIGGRFGIDSAGGPMRRRGGLWPSPKAALGLLLLGSPWPGWAAYQSRGFPPAHELFAPLLADAADPHFGFSLGAVARQRGLARVDLGDYLGIYRLAFPGDIGAAQLNLGGAINTRFDATTHNIQVIDYYGDVPIDIRVGEASVRLMFYHDSSHLGDDYLKDRNIQTVAHSWEALRAVVAFSPVKPLRLYGGYTKAIHTKPAWTGYQAVQGGAEIYFNTSKSAHWHPYWANDVQVWERAAWSPTWTSQLGLKTAADYSKGRGISYFVQFMTGPRLEGQFFTQKETVWSAGLRFALSANLLTPSAPPAPQGLP